MKQQQIIEHLKEGAYIVRTFYSKGAKSDLINDKKEFRERIRNSTVDAMLRHKIIFLSLNDFGGLTKHYFKIKPNASN